MNGRNENSQTKRRGADRRLIDSAAALAPLLREVRPHPSKPGFFNAQAPCHTSKSGKHTAFDFGDAPSGGLKILCSNAGCSGPGYIRRVEDALGVRLQIPLPDGRKTYEAPPPRQKKGSSHQVPTPFAAPIQVSMRRRSTLELPVRLHTNDLTIQGLYDAPVWFAGTAKMPFFNVERDGQTYAWRQSLPPERGGITRVREGGPATDRRGDKTYMMLPHASRSIILGTLRAMQADSRTTCPPQQDWRIHLSLAGDADWPFPIDVGAVDFDLKRPKNGPLPTLSVLWRDRLRAALEELGLPTATSASGVNFHALYRIEPADISGAYRLSRSGRWANPAGLPKEPELLGAQCEIFPPSTHKLLAFDPDRLSPSFDESSPIPRLGYAALARVLERTAAAALNEAGRYETQTALDADCDLCRRRLPAKAKSLVDGATKCLDIDDCQAAAERYRTENRRWPRRCDGSWDIEDLQKPRTDTSEPQRRPKKVSDPSLPEKNPNSGVLDNPVIPWG